MSGRGKHVWGKLLCVCVVCVVFCVVVVLIKLDLGLIVENYGNLG